MLKSVNLRDYMLTHPVKVKPDDNIVVTGGANRDR